MSPDEWFQQAADAVFSRIHQSAPHKKMQAARRLISHRGEHDNATILENSLQAFDAAKTAGFWGIELDVRWTSDLFPVVFHDPDLTRLFQDQRKIKELSLEKLKTDFPAIPTLEQVVARYAGRLHLMVELKKEPYPDPARQNQVLARLFKDLASGRDFHFLSLHPPLFEYLPFFPKAAFLPIARIFVSTTSRLAIGKGYGGITGHYALVGRRVIRRHHELGNKVGTGIIRSANSLYREMKKGVDWLFTENLGPLLQKMRKP